MAADAAAADAAAAAESTAVKCLLYAYNILITHLMTKYKCNNKIMCIYVQIC